MFHDSTLFFFFFSIHVPVSMTSDHQEFEQDRPGLISRICCMQSSPETDPRLFSTGKKTVIMSLVIMCVSTAGLFATVCFPGNVKRCSMCDHIDH